jgi:hypothetical protein
MPLASKLAHVYGIPRTDKVESIAMSSMSMCLAITSMLDSCRKYCMRHVNSNNLCSDNMYHVPTRWTCMHTRLRTLIDLSFVHSWPRRLADVIRTCRKSADPLKNTLSSLFSAGSVKTMHLPSIRIRTEKHVPFATELPFMCASRSKAGELPQN